MSQGVSHHVAEPALEHFGTTLCYYYRHLRTKYLSACVDNIKANTSVLYSMTLIRKILDSYGTQMFESKSEVLDAVNESHELYSAVFGSLVKFKHETTMELMA
jgi:hypothetical protein